MKSRLVDRYETGAALLVALWTAAFVLRSNLAQAERLSDVADEALLSLLIVVPIMLIGWGVLAIADRLYGFGMFRSNRRR